MGLKTAGINVGLDAIAAVTTHLSLHTAWPATTGNEVTGGSYARQAIVWGAASSGSVAITGTETFSVPASTTVVAVGGCSASTAGTVYSDAPAGGYLASPFYAAASTDMLTSDAHGLTDGMTVVLIDTVGASLPTGVSQGTIYYVVSTSGDTIKLALTSGGTAIDLTTDGGGMVVRVTPETFNNAGTYDVSAYSVNVNALSA